MVGDILQPTHLLFILVVALLVLGPKRLPEVGRQLGSGLRDFRAAINGERSERQDEQPPEAFVPEPAPEPFEESVAPADEANETSPHAGLELGPDRFESAVPEQFAAPEHEASLEQPGDASHEVPLEQPGDASHEVSLEQPEPAERQPAPRT